jgi:hypothetical protein
MQVNTLIYRSSMIPPIPLHCDIRGLFLDKVIGQGIGQKAQLWSCPKNRGAPQGLAPVPAEPAASSGPWNCATPMQEPLHAREP